MKQITLLAVCLYCFSFLACKKIDDTENFINTKPENNKVLEESYKKAMTGLRKEANDKMSPSYYLSKAKPNWEKSISLTEKNIFIIPLQMNLSDKNKKSKKNYAFALYNRSGNLTQGQFFMIRNTNNDLEEPEAIELAKKFVLNPEKQNIPPGNIISTISMTKKNADIANGNIVFLKEKVHKGSEGSSNYEAENCEANGGTIVTIDWYYQTWVNGILVNEEYLFTTHECWGGGGGGGGAGGGGGSGSNCNTAIEDFAGLGHSVEQTVSRNEVIDNNTATVYFDWMIYKAITWGIMSREKVVFYRNASNKPWNRSEYTHLGDSPTGMVIGGTRNYSIQYIHPTDYAISCKVEIGFSVTSSLSCAGSSISLTTAHTALSLIKAPLSHVVVYE